MVTAYAAHPNIQSGRRNMVMLKPKIYWAAKPCEWCRKKFTVPRKQDTQVRRFCGTSCSARWRVTLPEIQDACIKRMLSANREHPPWLGKKRPDSADLMRRRNPMRDPKTRAKMAASLRGRPWSGVRGGNGKISPAQELLANALELPMEFAVSKRNMQGMNLPSCYKIDIASIPYKAAIEVDGRGHMNPKSKRLDAKKESALRSAGWRVLRVTNEEIQKDLTAVIEKCRRFIVLK